MTGFSRYTPSQLSSGGIILSTTAEADPIPDDAPSTILQHEEEYSMMYKRNFSNFKETRAGLDVQAKLFCLYKARCDQLYCVWRRGGSGRPVSALPITHETIEVARQLYGDFVPECKSQGMFGPVHVYVANLVPGPAFCRVRSQFFSPAPAMEQRLQQTVQDFARSDTTSMVVYVVCLVDERLV